MHNPKTGLRARLFSALPPVLLLTLLWSANGLRAQSVSATYSSGDIPTSRTSWNASCNGPGTSLTLTLPPGGPWTVTGADVVYTMTAQNGGFKSDQRSYLFCSTTGLAEPDTAAGVGNEGGIQSYNRTGLALANGTYAGGAPIVIEMRAWRTAQGPAGVSCNTTFNRVDNFSWMVTLHYAALPSTGAVGIGTTTPDSSAALHVDGLQKGFLPPRMGTAYRLAIIDPAEGLLVYDTDLEALFIQSDGLWRNLATGGQWEASGGNVFRPSGNVGIGISAPAFPLDMKGQIRLQHESPTVRPGIWFRNQDGAEDRALLGMSEPDSTLGIYSPHLSTWAVEFELMREPRIGINMQPGAPPRSELHVIHTNAGSSNDGVRIQNEGSNGNYWNLYTANTTGAFEFYSQGLKRAMIDPTSGVYTAVSDARLKTSIEPLGDVLSGVMSLQPKTYLFTNQDTDRRYTGFLAQELENVFPQFVHYGGDDQKTYSVDYGSMSVIALKAIQEQQARIASLESGIETLKEEQQARIESLESEIETLKEMIRSLARD